MNGIPESSSGIHEVADALEANELFQRNGWTDGLPIVPPTEDAVARFLAAARLEASAEIDFIEDILKKEYRVRECIRRRKPDASRPVPRPMLMELRGADAILAATGD